MKNEKSSKELLFLEAVNKNTDEQQLIEKLIRKLETLGFNIIDKENVLVDIAPKMVLKESKDVKTA